MWLADVPEPECGINDVLIRVLRTGICGTDLHIHNWDAWASRTIPVPMVIGHEFVGEVVWSGSNVPDFHPGEVVSGEGHVVCGRCRNCLAGRRHLCAHTQGVGVNRPGAFAEMIALPDDQHLASPRRHRLDVAAIFDPVRQRGAHGAVVPGAGRGRADHRRRPDRHAWRPRSSGTPARGTWPSPISTRSGCALAERLGATVTSTRARRLAEIQNELGMTEGFDVGLEMSGSAAAFRDDGDEHGPRRADRRCSALPTGEIVIDGPVITNMLTIRGIYGREMYETWYQMTVMLQSGLDISPVITHRFPYGDFAEAFDVAASGSAGKVILDW